jgi:pSer/pThr/pTyr-binding forkhead associated (FHA) protein
VRLDEQRAVLGRSRDCDVVLPASEVSRRHAEITSDGGGAWFIADLGSTNGVRVNGQSIVGQHQLQDGDVVELGNVPLRFEVE